MTSPKHRSGRHFLQIPGPTNMPERIGRALSRATIDHRGPGFVQLTQSLLERLGALFKTQQPVIVYPSSARGAWEAALVNVLAPGDKVLFCDSGHFAALWSNVATRLGLEVERLEGDWRRGVDPDVVAARLADDTDGEIRAVVMVHNETSTGVASDVAAVRNAIDKSNHEALFMVDVVSSIGSMAYEHDAWGVDVAVAGSQKGLMMPPGLGFNALSEKAIAAAAKRECPSSYWEWAAVLRMNERGLYPYTPATNLLFGLDEALNMLFEEGLDQVFARHQQLATATRAAVAGWGLEVYCTDPSAHSPTLTAVLVPDGHDADAFRRLVLERFDMSLGTGLGQGQGKLFRIGHLGDFNELMLMGTLCGVEMGLARSGVPHQDGGVLQAMEVLEKY